MPAGRPKSIDDNKVFDVAKPGNAKPIATSRPVITSPGTSVTDTSVVSPGVTAAAAPSVSRKVIKPISITSEDVSPEVAVSAEPPTENTPASSIVILDEPKKATKKTAKTETTVVEPEAATAPEVTDPAPEQEAISAEASDDVESEKLEDTPDQAADTAAGETRAKDTAASDTSVSGADTEEAKPADTPAPVVTGKKLLKPKRELNITPPSEAIGTKTEEAPGDGSKAEDAEVSSATTETPGEKPTEDTPVPDRAESTESSEAGSDAAGVDALAEASTKSKEEQKAAEEQAKRDAALQGLIDSKKYFVPLAHDATQKKGHQGLWVFLLVLLVLVMGAYLAIDAKIVKTGIDLPYHIFPQ